MDFTFSESVVNTYGNTTIKYNEVLVYPNPSKGIINIHIKNKELTDSEIEIFNIKGEKLNKIKRIKQQVQ